MEASRDIGTPLVSACETGQLSFASSAILMKSASLTPSAEPLTDKTIPVMPSPGTNVAVASVSRTIDVPPALPRRAEKAIEKQAA